MYVGKTRRICIVHSEAMRHCGAVHYPGNRPNCERTHGLGSGIRTLHGRGFALGNHTKETAWRKFYARDATMSREGAAHLFVLGELLKQCFPGALQVSLLTSDVEKRGPCSAAVIVRDNP